MQTDRTESLSSEANTIHYAHAELTRLIIGLVFDAYKELGFGFQEKYYQRAVALRFDEAKLPYQRERPVPITSRGRIIGRYFIDFVVDERVVLELKVANEFYESHVRQVVGYLKATGLSVGLIARITPQSAKIKRIIV